MRASQTKLIILLSMTNNQMYGSIRFNTFPTYYIRLKMVHYTHIKFKHFFRSPMHGPSMIPIVKSFHSHFNHPSQSYLSPSYLPLSIHQHPISLTLFPTPINPPTPESLYLLTTPIIPPTPISLSLLTNPIDPPIPISLSLLTNPINTPTLINKS